MSYKTIYSNRCWIDSRLQPASIHIKDGLIASIEKGEKPDNSPEANFILMPGVIDAHVHINEPGRTEWEGFETATKAAAAGGISTLVDMPLNASPVTTTTDAFEQKIDAATGKLFVNVGYYGGVIPGNADSLQQLIDKGVLGFKCFLVHSGIDEFPNVSLGDLEKAMPIIAASGLPLLAHCEFDHLPAASAFADHPSSYREYVKSRPGNWEQEAVDMMISFCRKYDCPVHIVHVSYAGCLESIARAKAEGLKLTAETCPHYILFHEEEIPDAQTIYKCAPPIRDRQNNLALINALADGTLDLIGSDHSPAPPIIKEIDTGNLEKAWGGIAGLQFLLPASYSALSPQLAIEKIIPLLTERPAKMVHLDHRKGFIKEGYDADLVLWNPDCLADTDSASIYHRYKISPYADKPLKGKVIKTWVCGEQVFEVGSFHAGFGRSIFGKYAS
jgi:allantoinase